MFYDDAESSILSSVVALAISVLPSAGELLACFLVSPPFLLEFCGFLYGQCDDMVEPKIQNLLPLSVVEGWEFQIAMSQDHRSVCGLAL